VQKRNKTIQRSKYFLENSGIEISNTKNVENLRFSSYTFLIKMLENIQTVKFEKKLKYEKILFFAWSYSNYTYILIEKRKIINSMNYYF